MTCAFDVHCAIVATFFAFVPLQIQKIGPSARSDYQGLSLSQAQPQKPNFDKIQTWRYVNTNGNESRDRGHGSQCRKVRYDTTSNRDGVGDRSGGYIYDHYKVSILGERVPR